MCKYQTITERAIILLNNRALMIHYNDFKLRHDRLVNRLIGDRVVSPVRREKRFDEVRR